ncbi:MAG: enoyl-ACP reductase [Phycisphaeraceae bacterium]|nr:enoyl-ACP reductase [Phycisphaeraceae bacterium]
MGLLDGKRGIVFGIANDRSYAWFITQELVAHGAQCCFTHLPDDKGKMERRCRQAIEELGITDPWLMPCDATKDEDLDAVFAKLKQDFGSIDFVIHSIAFADRQFLQLDYFHKTTRQAWTQALDVSAYTLLAMGQRVANLELMPKGGSMLAMSYYGGEKVCPGYNVMGIAKAALEHTARYLAYELGKKAIRVNTISGGPLRTLAASAVGGISEMFEHMERKSAMRRNITGEEVGRTAVYLVSDLSTGVTGENIHVDAGFSIVGL